MNFISCIQGWNKHCWSNLSNRIIWSYMHLGFGNLRKSKPYEVLYWSCTGLTAQSLAQLSPSLLWLLSHPVLTYLQGKNSLYSTRGVQAGVGSWKLFVWKSELVKQCSECRGKKERKYCILVATIFTITIRLVCTITHSVLRQWDAKSSWLLKLLNTMDSCKHF